MPKFDVVTIGSALRDVMFYSDEFHLVDNPKDDPTCRRLIGAEFGAKIRSDDVHFLFGGGASNTAVNFAGLGLKTGILAGVGDDLDGSAIEQHLADAKVNTTLMQRSKKYRTGLSFLSIEPKTHEHIAHIYYGAARDLSVSAKTLKKVNTKWFYISSLNMNSWRSVLRAATEHGARIAWNPGGTQLKAGYGGLKAFFTHTSVLLLNTDEATELVLSHPKHEEAGTVRQMLKTIHEWGPEIVVITDGRKGAYAYDGEKVHHQQPRKDKVKDTTGAGDCFGSSFISGLMRYNTNIEKSMKLAIRNTTSLVHSIGAQTGLLKWRDLPKTLKQK